MRDYLTAKELAEIERVHRATVTRWINRRLFPNARLVAKEWRIPIAEYEAGLACEDNLYRRQEKKESQKLLEKARSWSEEIRTRLGTQN